MGKAAVWAAVALTLVVGAAVVQGPRAAVFTLLGCVTAGALLFVVERSRSDRR